MYQSQREIVLNYLEKHHTITTYECFTELDIVDLQKAIQLLRNEGYIISDKWISKIGRNGKIKHFKEYRLEGIE